MKKLFLILTLLSVPLLFAACNDNNDDEYDNMMNDGEYHSRAMDRMMGDDELRREYFGRMMEDEDMRDYMLDSMYQYAERDSVFMGRVYDYMLRYPGVNDRMRYYFEEENK